MVTADHLMSHCVSGDFSLYQHHADVYKVVRNSTALLFLLPPRRRLGCSRPVAAQPRVIRQFADTKKVFPGRATLCEFRCVWRLVAVAGPIFLPSFPLNGIFSGVILVRHV